MIFFINVASKYDKPCFVNLKMLFQSLIFQSMATIFLHAGFSNFHFLVIFFFLSSIMAVSKFRDEIEKSKNVAL